MDMYEYLSEIIFLENGSTSKDPSTAKESCPMSVLTSLRISTVGFGIKETLIGLASIKNLFAIPMRMDPPVLSVVMKLLVSGLTTQDLHTGVVVCLKTAFNFLNVLMVGFGALNNYSKTGLVIPSVGFYANLSLEGLLSGDASKWYSCTSSPKDERDRSSYGSFYCETLN